MEPRVGGTWISQGRGSTGAPFTVKGEILAWNPPDGYTQTWVYDWDAAAQTPTRIDWRLEPIEGGTRVTVRHTGFADAEGCLDHANGWESVLGWLSGHLQKPLLKAM
jgi:uncharacterized protein YndB with AHSA1/START domain